MKEGVRRPIYAYLFQVFWLVIATYWSVSQTSDIGQWTFRILAAYGLVALIHKMVRYYYFLVVDNKLVLHDNIFKKRTIDLDRIEKIELKIGVFSFSEIILKDKTKIIYSDSQTDNKELKRLMARYKIVVE